MREIINLHLGQAGVQIGNAVWELLCIEHGIDHDGFISQDKRKNESLEPFFAVSSADKFTPKTIFIDLEPTVIDEIRTGSYSNLFHPNRLITGAEDASNNFARGYFTVGKLLIDRVNKEVRKLVEICENVHAIMIFRSLGGGTGSGFTSAMFDFLAEYPKTNKLEIIVYPSSTQQSSTVEPYNSLLAQHFGMEEIDVGILVENESLYSIIFNKLKQVYVPFVAINRIIAQVCSNMTASLRFENTVTSDLSILQNNIVPYPRIHFPMCSFSPILPESVKNHESLSVSEITRSLFDNDNQLICLDHSLGKLMSCSINYRGNVSPSDVYKALVKIKNNKIIQFVDWCPTGFKVGINLCPPSVVPESGLSPVPRNGLLLTNTSAIGRAWGRLTNKFSHLYSKKAFIHWFVEEGLEEGEFTEALSNISSLVKDYEEIVLETNTTNASNVAQVQNNQSNQWKESENPKSNPKKRNMETFRKMLEKKRKEKLTKTITNDCKTKQWGKREEKLFEILKRSLRTKEQNFKISSNNNKVVKVKNQNCHSKSITKVTNKIEYKIK